jgi:hypothetical protein
MKINARETPIKTLQQDLMLMICLVQFTYDTVRFLMH